MNLAVVGCGYWGKNLIRVTSSLEPVSVATCCHQGDPENARWVREEYPDVPLTTDYEAVLTKEGIDCVVIATPIETHYRLARSALDHGKHVFVEKPLTRHTDTARELVKLADDNDLVLFVGYIFIHHPVFRELLAIHDESPVEGVRFTWRKTGDFSEDVVENLASHDVAMAQRLFGQPHSVTVLDSFQWLGDRNAITVRGSFADGQMCRIDLNRLSPVKRKSVTVVTESDALWFWSGERLWQFDEATEEFTKEFESSREPLEIECRAFADAVLDGSDPETDGKFGRKVTETIERI